MDRMWFVAETAAGMMGITEFVEALEDVNEDMNILNRWMNDRLSL